MAVKPRLWTRGFILDTLVNFLIYIIYYMLVVIIASEAISSLNATVSEAGLAAGIFVLGTLAARLAAGRSVEIYGRKKMLYGGILFYLVTTCMYFAVDSLPLMYGVRFLNGIGYGIASTATSTIVSAMIPEERRGEGINYYALSMSLAAAIGPFLGMMMQQFFSFRIIIMFCVAVVLACLAAAFVMKVDEIRITEERRAQLKEISLSSFLEPKVMGIAIVGFFVALCYSSVLSFLATYASELHLMTAGTLFFVVYALSVTIIRPVAGVMFDKKGEDFVMYPTFLCLGNACGRRLCRTGLRHLHVQRTGHLRETGRRSPHRRGRIHLLRHAGPGSWRRPLHSGRLQRSPGLLRHLFPGRSRLGRLRLPALRPLCMAP